MDIIQIIYQFVKGRSQKYIKRVPTGNPNRPWRYLYADEIDTQGKSTQEYENKKGQGEITPEETKSRFSKMFSFFGLNIGSMSEGDKRRKSSEILTSHVDEFQRPGTPSINLNTMKNHMLEYFTNKSAWDKYFKAKEEKKAQALAASPQPSETITPRQPRQPRETGETGAQETTESQQPEREAQTVRYQDRAYRLSVMKFLYNKYKGVTTAAIPNTQTTTENAASSSDSSTISAAPSMPVSNPADLQSIRETFIGHTIESDDGIVRHITIINRLDNGKYSVTLEKFRGNPASPREFEITQDDFNAIMAGNNGSIGGVTENTFGDTGDDNFDTMPDEEVQSVVGRSFSPRNGNDRLSITGINKKNNGEGYVVETASESERKSFVVTAEQMRAILNNDFSSIGGFIGDTSHSTPETTIQPTSNIEPSNVDPIIVSHLFNQKFNVMSNDERKTALIAAGGNVWEFRNMRRVYFEKEGLGRGEKFYYNLATQRFEGKNISSSKVSELANKVKSKIVYSNQPRQNQPNNFETMPESIPSAGNQLEASRVAIYEENFGAIISRMPIDVNDGGETSFGRNNGKFDLLNALKEPIQAVQYTPQQQRKFDRYERDNDTGKLVLEMAKISGNEKAIALAKHIIKEHIRVGHLTAELNYARSMLLLRLQGNEIPNSLLPESLRGNTAPIQAQPTATISEPVTPLQDPTQSDESDPVTKTLDPKVKTKANKVVTDSIKMMFDRLAGYQTSPFAVKLRENNITLESLQAGISDKTNVRDILKQLHENLKAVDNAHTGLGRPSYDWAQNSDGYANAIYNEAIKRLVASDLLPAGYDQKIKRTSENRMGAIDIPPARELAERAKRAATEVMRQNSELMNTHAENLTFAQEYFNRPLSLQDKVKLAKGLNKAFGKDFSLKGWVESVQHPDPRLTTKIDLDINDLISAGGNSRTTTEIPFKYIIKEISSDKMVTESAITRSITRNEDGSFKINNFCFSRIKGEFDNTYRNIASSIYSGTEKLLRDITANLPEQAKKASYINIGQAANSGFSDTGYAGAVVWAKNHYDFANLKEATVWRKDHKAIIDSHGARLGLTPEKIQELKAKVDACKYPYEFMSLGHKLSKEDCERAGGINRDIKRVIQDTGGYDIGAWIMLKRGTWWNAVNYINGSNDPARQRRVEHLNQQRDKARAIRAARSAERAANPNRPVTPPSQPVSESSAPTQSTTPSQSTTRRRTQGTRSTPRSGLPNASLGTMRVLNGSEIAGESFPSGLFLHRDGNKWAISHHKSGKRMLKVKNRALAQAAIVRLSTKNWEKSDVGVLASESHMSLLRGTINSIERDPNGFLREVMPSLAALQEAARSASRRRRRT